MYGICADSRRSVTIARTSSSSVMTVFQHRTNLCQGRSRFRTASARPLEPQLPPHPGEVVGGGAGAALAVGHVLHALEERDELGMRGLDARGLARGAPVEGGNRLVEPLPVMLLVELGDGGRRRLGRNLRGRAGRDGASLRRLPHVLVAR